MTDEHTALRCCATLWPDPFTHLRATSRRSRGGAAERDRRPVGAWFQRGKQLRAIRGRKEGQREAVSLQ